MRAETGFGPRVVAHVQQQRGALETGGGVAWITRERNTECGKRQSVLALTAQHEPKIVMETRMSAIAVNQAAEKRLGLRPVLLLQSLLKFMQFGGCHLNALHSALNLNTSIPQAVKAAPRASA